MTSDYHFGVFKLFVQGQFEVFHMAFIYLSLSSLYFLIICLSLKVSSALFISRKETSRQF